MATSVSSFMEVKTSHFSKEVNVKRRIVERNEFPHRVSIVRVLTVGDLKLACRKKLRTHSIGGAENNLNAITRCNTRFVRISLSYQSTLYSFMLVDVIALNPRARGCHRSRRPIFRHEHDRYSNNTAVRDACYPYNDAYLYFQLYKLNRINCTISKIIFV